MVIFHGEILIRIRSVTGSFITFAPRIGIFRLVYPDYFFRLYDMSGVCLWIANEMPLWDAASARCMAIVEIHLKLC